MHVVFLSNFMNHHQLPFCECMVARTEGKFTFIATSPTPQDRLSLGYHDMNKAYPFVLTSYDCPENAAKAKELLLTCDVAIIGALSNSIVNQRIRAGKLTFFFSERLYRKSTFSLQHIRRYLSSYIRTRGYFRKSVYLLCASAYTAADYAKVGAYKGKTYKWGYFPEIKPQNPTELFMHKRTNRKASILWVARLIGLKHPEAAIQLAEKLKANGYGFEVNLIGNGEMEAQLKEMIHSKGLADCVHMLGAMSPEAVRVHMEQADIFLFTSDFNEGWGAVLNESMNSACAVVASHAIGSVPFLIQDGENGIIYKNGDLDSLYAAVVRLMENPELREKLGRSAYETMASMWNARVAAERFVKLTQELRASGNCDLFENGPCSRAETIRNDWFGEKNDF